MDRVKIALWAICMALVFVCVGYYTSLVEDSTDLKHAREQNAALTEQAVVRGTTDVKQSEVRATVKARTASVLASNKKEASNAQDHPPSLSDGQLDRLRRLRDAANDGIHSAE